MFAWIKSLTAAGNRLARTLTSLAETCEEVNAGLRDQLGLDKPARGGRKVIEAKAETVSNGHGTDN